MRNEGSKRPAATSDHYKGNYPGNTPDARAHKRSQQERQVVLTLTMRRFHGLLLTFTLGKYFEGNCGSSLCVNYVTERTESTTKSMPLLEILKASPDAVAKMTLEQIIAVSGDSQLTDGSTCSEEFREYLRSCDIDRMSAFINSCLNPGSKLGLALQDIVNELGHRLSLSVEPGRYRGTTGQIGYDGIWTNSEGRSIVVEVKTTDAYRINLDTITTYREKLIDANRISRTSSVLIVVGREDTGDLEAQVRGSRHAWDVRIISVEALLRLCQVRLKTESTTQTQIEQLLIPFEYTRLDRIIDITFAAVRDVEEAIDETSHRNPGVQSVFDLSQEGHSQARTPSALLEAARQATLAKISELTGIRLVKRSRATYSSSDGTLRVACSVSKIYQDGGLWYAHHPSWEEFLSHGTSSFLALAVAELPTAFLLPIEFLSSELDNFNTTNRNGSHYWHVVIRPDGDSWRLIRPNLAPISLARYTISL